MKPDPEALAAWDVGHLPGGVDILSDLHLDARSPRTAAALERHCANTAAGAVIILGDLAEAWIGDDAADEPGEESDLLALLERAAARRRVAFMAGNRDFLLSPRRLAQVGVQALADPCELHACGQRVLLSHGDALCIDDVAYQAFRRQVRAAAWQRQVLAQPLAERRAYARQVRAASLARHADPNTSWADVDPAAARALLDAHGCTTLIHGHTHRPGFHDLGDGFGRWVLSDWDADHTPWRADVLHLDARGQRRLAPAGWPPAA